MSIYLFSLLYPAQGHREPEAYPWGFGAQGVNPLHCTMTDTLAHYGHIWSYLMCDVKEHLDLYE